MHLDLATLYTLVVGTLLVGMGMILWERAGRPERARELRLLATAFGILAAGCLIAVTRWLMPWPIGAAAANIVIVAGYLTVLDGIAAFDGRGHRVASAVTLALLAVAWAAADGRWPVEMWSYVGGVPIVGACAATAIATMRSRSLRPLRARRVVAAVSAAHAFFYAGRVLLLPIVAALHGPDVIAAAATATMYESVLFSVGLPMALMALVREEAHDGVLRVSRSDYLTGLGNRQWFFEEGARLLAAAAGGTPVALLAFDLDRFKAVNDRHGHATGDEVLRAFARAVRSALGGDALVARLGGEEFSALLPGRDAARARDAGEAVARRFARAEVMGPDGEDVRPTVSIGVAERCADAADLASLLAAADRALYVAKALGRDRIELAPVRAAA